MIKAVDLFCGSGGWREYPEEQRIGQSIQQHVKAMV